MVFGTVMVAIMLHFNNQDLMVAWEEHFEEMHCQHYH